MVRCPNLKGCVGMRRTTSTLTDIALPIVLTLVGLLLGVLVRRTVLPRLVRAAARTSSPADDAVVAALRGPVVLWCGVTGLYLGLQLVEPPRPFGHIAQQILVVTHEFINRLYQGY